MPDDLRITATPHLRVVTPGAKVTYRLEPAAPGTVLPSPEQCTWFCINDPQSVTFFRPSRFQGPFGRTDWTDATWDFTGHHRIVCRVRRDTGSTDYVYDQVVAPLSELLQAGPTLPLGKDDPEAVLDGTSRFVELVLKIAEGSPPPEALREKYKDEIARYESFRDHLKERLQSTHGSRRYPIQAEHFDSTTQRRTPLKVFIAQAADGWHVVDWTNPTVRGMTGDYKGDGSTPKEGIEDALRTWDEDNRYPDGGIIYRVSGVPDVPVIEGSFTTDGSSFWDSVSTFFTWVGLGAAAVAGVVTLLAPVPGSQLVSAAIWTSIFSSTAAATINIGQRYEEGFSGWQANAFDVLSIVANMFGVAGVLWSRGAQVTVQTSKGLLKAVLVGQVATDSVQGIMIGADHFAEIERIRNDPSLTPTQKANRILELCRSLAVAGALIYINIKGTSKDLAALNKAPEHLEGLQAPAEKLKQLGDPNAELDLTKPPLAEGHPKDGPHKTTVQIDQEEATPHAGGRARAVRQKTRGELLREAMTHEQYALHEQWLPGFRAAHPEFGHLTDTELIAIRGYTGDHIWVGELRDYRRLNNALRTNDTQQLAILKPYIDELKSGLAKLEKRPGAVTRTIPIPREEVPAKFRSGETWRDPAFMSTTAGGADFPGNVTLRIRGKSGVSVKDMSIFPSENEILFAPGTEFIVVRVEETSPGIFDILLDEF